MNQSGLKRKTITGILRALLLSSLIICILQPMGALGQAIPISGWEAIGVSHPSIPSPDALAGVIFLDGPDDDV